MAADTDFQYFDKIQKSKDELKKKVETFKSVLEKMAEEAEIERERLEGYESSLSSYDNSKFRTLFQNFTGEGGVIGLRKSCPTTLDALKRGIERDIKACEALLADIEKHDAKLVTEKRKVGRGNDYSVTRKGVEEVEKQLKTANEGLQSLNTNKAIFVSDAEKLKQLMKMLELRIKTLEVETNFFEACDRQRDIEQKINESLNKLPADQRSLIVEGDRIRKEREDLVKLLKEHQKDLEEAKSEKEKLVKLREDISCLRSEGERIEKENAEKELDISNKKDGIEKLESAIKEREKQLGELEEQIHLESGKVRAFREYEKHLCVRLHNVHYGKEEPASEILKDLSDELIAKKIDKLIREIEEKHRLDSKKTQTNTPLNKSGGLGFNYEFLCFFIPIVVGIIGVLILVFFQNKRRKKEEK